MTNAGACRRAPAPTASCSGRGGLPLAPPPRRSPCDRPPAAVARPRRRGAPSSHRLQPIAACASPEIKGNAGRASRDIPAGADGSGALKTYDVVALSNLCVDIVLEVPELPPPEPAARQQLLAELTAAKLVEDETWEVGGNANFMISAARLGMAVASVGHVNEDDRFGAFLSRVLAEESVRHVERVPLPLAGDGADGAAETLLCFVLVDPDARHAFCSRYDFGPWPLLGHVKELPESSMQLLRDTRAVYINGFCFDELRPETVAAAMREARQAGAAVFFDPGPRSWTMLEGERRAAMDGVLANASVVLVTREEGEAITGESASEDIARAFLDRPGTEQLQWVVVKNGAEGATLFTREASYTAPGFSVDVEDTVGCGDSFAAAIVLGYVYQHDVSAILKLANAVGAATATQRGAGRNVGRPGTVEELLSGEEGCPDAYTLLRRSRDSSLDSGDLDWE
mmetsp:Transcript_17088/g.43383  ORF Transcript_17088/g.43383 Transcript_17088/m.43383 type:complete len:456 (+) Transcript_17088:91-1458(+)|eukprot:jgi/Tetstr1/420420/TSEL_011535.t1